MTERPTNPEESEGTHRTGNPFTRWTDCLASAKKPSLAPGDSIPLGIVRGEGVGPEVIDATMTVAEAVAAEGGRDLEIQSCDLVRKPPRKSAGTFEDLPPEIPEFCRDVFEAGGAVLCGPGGGRFVYDLRRELQLFFKISPLREKTANLDASPLKRENLDGLDILIVRENCGGVYQGSWSEIEENGKRRATQAFCYSETQVRDFLAPAARLAQSRNGQLTVVWKESGVPSISGLWADCAEEIAQEMGITCNTVDVDLMSYRLIREPSAFDVIAAPNLFGDVLADLGAVLVGTRGSTFSGNFDKLRNGVYQTNHGAAFDLEGKGVANPTGQIFSYAMMLRESFGLFREANAIETAVRRGWAKGHLSADMQTLGKPATSTAEMGELIAEEAVAILSEMESDSVEIPEPDAPIASTG